MLGAREGALTGLRRLAAAAMARDISVFIVPGPEIARAHGLDIVAAGLRPVTSPRHASVLLVVGPLTAALRDAASVVYAQMVRPRAVFALGSGDLLPLPVADVVAGLSQEELVSGVRRLRQAFAEGAFRPDISDFDAPALQIRIEYTCPMHPEVVSDEPGSCPKCGMTLMPRETQATSGHAHAHGNQSEPKADLTAPAIPARSHAAHTHHAEAETGPTSYTCPMHPEVVSDTPGSCPKCGMNLVPREGEGHGGHGGHGHHAEAESGATSYTCPMHP